MKRHIVTTADGSHSLYVPELDEHFHSRHGAIQESMHVFIRMGWDAIAREKPEVKILEIGLGTGLNALLTLLRAQEEGKSVLYSSVEAFPLSPEEVEQLNYAQELLLEQAQAHLKAIHEAPWNEAAEITPGFTLHKILGRIEDSQLPEQVDVIYFDAFAPNKQPELWTQEVFERMFQSLNLGGLLVTYCAKGDVKRAMKAAGFTIEKVAGPPGKREMIRGWKNAP